MKRLKSSLLLLFVGFAFADPVLAEMFVADSAMPAPQAPETNPHPPQTEADKKRVAFAELALQTLLKNDYPSKETQASKAASQVQYIIKDDGKNQKLALSESCLRSKSCLAGRDDVRRYIESVRQSVGGSLSEFRHAHIIPWSWEAFQKQGGGGAPQSKTIDGGGDHSPGLAPPMSPTNVAPNEYLVHIYVLFPMGGWHHVDVVLTEEAGQGIRFNRFFIIQIPSNNSELPPGAVC